MLCRIGVEIDVGGGRWLEEAVVREPEIRT